jgi:hypothetical protein
MNKSTEVTVSFNTQFDTIEIKRKIKGNSLSDIDETVHDILIDIIHMYRDARLNWVYFFEVEEKL